jgi:hypothetical protein
MNIKNKKKKKNKQTNLLQGQPIYTWYINNNF